MISGCHHFNNLSPKLTVGRPLGESLFHKHCMGGEVRKLYLNCELKNLDELGPPENPGF